MIPFLSSIVGDDCLSDSSMREIHSSSRKRRWAPSILYDNGEVVAWFAGRRSSFHGHHDHSRKRFEQGVAFLQLSTLFVRRNSVLFNPLTSVPMRRDALEGVPQDPRTHCSLLFATQHRGLIWNITRFSKINKLASTQILNQYNNPSAPMTGPDGDAAARYRIPVIPNRANNNFRR